MAVNIQRALESVSLVCAVTLASCAVIPLPAGGPALERKPTIAMGMSRQQVRDELGSPELLDTPRFMVYEWGAGKHLVIMLLPAPPGAGGYVDTKQNYRMLVALDEADRVTGIRCSWLRQDREQRAPCQIDDIGLAGGATKLGESGVVIEPGLLDIVMSPDGRRFTGTDAEHRVWLYDTASGKGGIIHRGLPGSWNDNREPRASFSPSGDVVVVSQPGAGARIYRLLADGGTEVGAALADKEVELAEFSADGTEIFAYAAGSLRRYTPGLDLAGTAPISGRTTFGPKGIDRARLRSAALVLEGLWIHQGPLTPGIAAVVDGTGRGVAILDRRTPSERKGFSLNFQLSPDGAYLARNTCRHLELWRTGDIRERVDDARGLPVSPSAAFLMPIWSAGEFEWDPGGIFGVRHCRGSIAFTPNGKYVAAAADNTVSAWRIADGEQLALIVPPVDPADYAQSTSALKSNFAVQSIGFDATGNLLVVAGGRIQVWSLPTAGAPAAARRQ